MPAHILAHLLARTSKRSKTNASKRAKILLTHDSTNNILRFTFEIQKNQ